jgi:hypothetical protein
MTKSQSNQAFNTASGQNATAAANANSTYTAAQGDVGDYTTALGQYAASNPYVQGGQFQTAQNQGLADTGAAGAQSTAQAIQSSQVRSGQNPAAGIAAAEQVSEANNRNQMSQVAQGTESRLSGLANYGSSVLNATAKPEEMEQGLLNTETGSQSNTLGDEQKASQTPSFWQELGQGAINAGANFAKGMG